MLTSWKTIVVFLDDALESEKIGDYAAEIARERRTHLIGIYAISGHPGETAADSFARGKEAIRNVIAQRRTAEERKAFAVGRRFAAICERQDLSAEFRVVWGGRADADMPLHALHCDLVIVGHPKFHQLPEPWSPEQILMASGVPVLIVPDEWRQDTIGDKILVAWNASREARRAIADAMPFIGTAQSTTVLVVDADKARDKYGQEPGADIALYLARHGAHVEVEQASSDGSPIGEVILSRAIDRGADLIVIGAYSHARSIESIFGGVTRTVLAQTQVPVLISR